MVVCVVLVKGEGGLDGVGGREGRTCWMAGSAVVKR